MWQSHKSHKFLYIYLHIPTHQCRNWIYSNKYSTYISYYLKPSFQRQPTVWTLLLEIPFPYCQRFSSPCFQLSPTAVDWAIFPFCCCCSVSQSCLTLWDSMAAAHQASRSLTISWSLPKFMFIALVMLSSYLTLWHPLLLLPSIFPSIRDFSNESSVCKRWPNYWSFSFSISPSSEYSGFIFLDWFDLLAVQGTFRNLL